MENLFRSSHLQACFFNHFSLKRSGCLSDYEESGHVQLFTLEIYLEKVFEKGRHAIHLWLGGYI